MLLDGTPDPWATVADRFNRDVSLNRQVARQMGRLGEKQARTERLAVALEAGRVYGLRQFQGEQLLRRQLQPIRLQKHW